VHTLPFFGHTPPQKLPMHDPVQHSASSAHDRPSSVHVGAGAHLPSVQMPEQQWVLFAQ
jgi:hypothetical protein